MGPTPSLDQREQAALGLEQLAFLVRADAWRGQGTPALPPTQAGVLRMLAGEPSGLRPGHIAERVGVSPASLSDSLKALEARGWIRRDPDPDDGRAMRGRQSRPGRRRAVPVHRPASSRSAVR